MVELPIFDEEIVNPFEVTMTKGINPISGEIFGKWEDGLHLSRNVFDPNMPVAMVIHIKDNKVVEIYKNA